MVNDNPSDNIFNYFFELIFNGHPLSLSILGTKKSLRNLYSFDILNYFNSSFDLNGIVLSAAGNINHKDLVEKVKANIFNYNSNSGDSGGDSWGNSNDNSSDRSSGNSSDNNDNKKNVTGKILENKRIKKMYKGKTEASHICYGGLGCMRKSQDRYALSLFTNLLGGSMSSRLFQKIREEKGLSYTIFASNTQYTDTGVTAIYSATSPGNVYKVINLVNEEISDIRKNGIKAEELEIAKENTKGNIVLGVEDISSRMFRLGKALLIDEQVLTIDETLKNIDKVKLSDINDVVNKYFQTDKMSLVIIGKVNNGRPR
jgi:predicted Zn-dependent peptidase